MFVRGSFDLALLTKPGDIAILVHDVSFSLGDSGRFGHKPDDTPRLLEPSYPVSCIAPNDLLQDQMSKPSRPKLTLRIGVTGHRPNKLNMLDEAALDRINCQISDVFRSLDEIANDILKNNTDFYVNLPPELRLISGFAEGADQMAVALRPQHWRVEAVLPFSQEDFTEDFSTSNAAEAFTKSFEQADRASELPRDPIDRDNSYAVMGRFLLRQIDVLIAVWDGEHGKTGGTGTVAAAAVAQGIPVVWISAHRDQPPYMIEKLKAGGHPAPSGVDCMRGPLQKALTQALAPPNTRDDQDDEVDDRTSVQQHELLQYFAEKSPTLKSLSLFSLLKSICCGRRPSVWIRLKKVEHRHSDWDQFIADAPEVPELAERIRHVLLPRYACADNLAIHYANRYRGAYIEAYLLSFLAVAFALTKAIFELLPWTGFIEVALIFRIIWIINRGRSQKWHERWLNYRTLAESLRQMRFLCYIGEFGRVRAGGAPQSWVLWYVRSTARELGIPPANLEKGYQWRLLQATLVNEIRDQIKHHRINASVSEHINHVLHAVGRICFYSTCVALFFVFAVWLLSWSLHYLHAPEPLNRPGFAGGHFV